MTFNKFFISINTRFIKKGFTRTMNFKTSLLIIFLLLTLNSVSATYYYNLTPSEIRYKEIYVVDISDTTCSGFLDVAIYDAGDLLNFTFHNDSRSKIAFVGTMANSYLMTCDDGSGVHNSTNKEIIAWIDCDGSKTYNSLWNATTGNVQLTCDPTIKKSGNYAFKYKFLSTNIYASLPLPLTTSGNVTATGFFYPSQAQASSYFILSLVDTYYSLTNSVYIAKFGNGYPGGYSNKVYIFNQSFQDTGAIMLNNNWYNVKMKVKADCNGGGFCADYFQDEINYINTSVNNITDSGTLTNIDYFTIRGNNVNDIMYLDDFFICKGDCMVYNESSAFTKDFIGSAAAISLNVSNYVNALGSNYTNNLTYNLTYFCNASEVAMFTVFINNSFNKSHSLDCNGSINVLNGLYTPVLEGNFSISYAFTTNISPSTDNVTYNTSKFTADLVPPNITRIYYTINQGFVNNVTNVSMNCTDNVVTTLEYNLTFNDVRMFWGNVTRGTYKSNLSTLRYGNNTAEAICKDVLYSSYKSYYNNPSVISFILVDEVTGDPFNVSNLTSVKLYYSDNETLYDFKANNTAYVNFTTLNDNKLRFEFIYADNSVVNRYIDATLLDDDDNRICANYEGVTHYEQLILSATQKQAVMYSLFANCLIAADYTRFAYQDSFILKAYTINRGYNLYTYDGLQRVYLAAIDGGIQTYIQLDILEYNLQDSSINILSEDISYQRLTTSNATILIYYYNMAGNNDNISIQIINMDDDSLVFSSASFTDPNEVTIYFDYSTLTVNGTTLFKIIVNRFRDGVESSMHEYFNINAQSGLLNSSFAFTISFLLMLFGLTFAAARITFSWFGILIILGAVGFLSFAIITWYTLLLMAIELIVLIFTTIVAFKINQESLT